LARTGGGGGGDVDEDGGAGYRLPSRPWGRGRRRASAVAVVWAGVVADVGDGGDGDVGGGGGELDRLS